MPQSITGAVSAAATRASPPDPRALAHRPAARNVPARQTKLVQRSPAPISAIPSRRLGLPLSATSNRSNSSRVGTERSNRIAQPKDEHFHMNISRHDRAIFGNGYAGDGKSIRLDDLESSPQPNDPDCMASCIWRHDPRLRTKNVGRQQYESRVRGNGVIVFDCGHTAEPTRTPLHVPPVTWHHFDETGYPVPYRHACHDCDCHDRFMAQKLIIQVNQLPFKILRMNQQIEELIESRTTGPSQNVEEDPDIAELRTLVDTIVKSRDRDVWGIWEGWEEKWGEKLYMNRLGYVYGPDPVVKGVEYVFPPEEHSRDNKKDTSRDKSRDNGSVGTLRRG